MPTPKWKLVVDVGLQTKSEVAASSAASQVDNRANDLLLLIRTYTPGDKTSPLAVYLPGFTSLRLLLEKANKTPREDDLAQTLIQSYSSYCAAGKTPSDIAWMVARDYMVYSQPHRQPQNLLNSAVPQPNAALAGAINGAAAGRTLGLPSAMQQGQQNQPIQPIQPMYPNGPAAQHQIIPLTFQQLTQSYDFQQQLPGQPSA